MQIERILFILNKITYEEIYLVPTEWVKKKQIFDFPF